MKWFQGIAAGFLTIASFLPTIQAADFPARVRAGANVITLNGSGARNKNFINLYQAALYLPDTSNDAAAVIAADAPMAIRIEITSIFVSQAKLVAALNDGFQKSTGGNIAPFRNELLQFRQCFADAINKGDVFDIVYVSSTGVIVEKNGQQKDVIKGLAFKKAVFGIWLSNDPVDARLKQALLGF